MKEFIIMNEFALETISMCAFMLIAGPFVAGIFLSAFMPGRGIPFVALMGIIAEECIFHGEGIFIIHFIVWGIITFILLIFPYKWGLQVLWEGDIDGAVEAYGFLDDFSSEKKEAPSSEKKEAPSSEKRKQIKKGIDQLQKEIDQLQKEIREIKELD